MLNIVLFGAPGAGKGTQAKFITEKYNLGHISTGDIIRAEIKAESTLGLKAKNIVEAGGLLSDEIVVELLENHIMKNSVNYSGFLFDGFPRTVGQCHALEEMMCKLKTSVSALVSLDVPQEELVARLLKRAEIEGRKDDTPEVIQNRFLEYNAKTLPVMKFYEDGGKVISINGTGSIEEITAQIISEIDKLKN
ncbi:MAG: adenylate kinase [Chitinivibrionia bacterium]|jgi:adenylate kinase|nr:adenylate kinase [Chitinivibrionia bacterium]